MQKHIVRSCMIFLVFSMFQTRALSEGVGSSLAASLQRKAQHREILRIGRGTANSIAWSPDGKTLAVGGSMGIWLYTSALKDIAYFESEAEPVTSISWSPDGTKIANGGTFDGDFVQIRDAKTGMVQQKFTYNNVVLALAWSPDGTKIAITGMSNSYQIDIRDIATGNLLETLDKADNTLTELAWSPDGKKLVAGGYGGPIYVWDMSTGLLLNTLNDYASSVTSLAWSPDGKILAATGTLAEKHVARLWNTANFRLLSLPTSVEAATVDWNPSGTKLVSSLPYGGAVIWDSLTGKIEINLDGSLIRQVQWSPNGKILAGITIDHTLMLWDSMTGHVTTQVDAYNDIPWKISWRPHNQQLAVKYLGQTSIDIVDSQTGKRITTLKSPSETSAGLEVTDFAWSPDGNYILATFDDRRTYLWTLSIASGSVPTLLYEANYNPFISWSHDSTKIIVVSGDDDTREVTIRNATTGQLIAKLSAETSRIAEAVWSPNGKLIATSTYDEQTQFWDATTYLPIQGFEKADAGLSPRLTFIQWSPDSTYLAGALCGTEGNKVCSFFTWNIAQKHLSAPFAFETGWTRNFVVSPDGKYIATDDGRLVYIWDSATGQLADTLEGHVAQITSISWSPNSNKLVTTSNDGSIRVWDIQY